MEKIYLKARGKVNLVLNILNKRADGYHNLESIFQKINFYDEMWLEKNYSNKFELESNITDVKLEDNIIYKAYQKIKQEYSDLKGVKVVLNKKIPMQAGLAGGSTDCSSFILGINKLFDLKMSKEKIEKIASQLGADVVPCLYNCSVKAEGIGEIITEIETNYKYYFVIIKPTFSSSTKEMYEKIDNIEIKQHSLDNVIRGLKNKDIDLISSNLYNSFEEVLKDKIEIINAKRDLIENGAMNTLISGSGACVFGIFKTKELAKKAYNNLKTKHETYICTSYNSRRHYYEK